MHQRTISVGSISDINSVNGDSSEAQLSSSATSTSSFMSSHPGTRKNPVVSAILSSNTMKNCHEVRDMYITCVNSKSNSAVCETAKNYFVSCNHSDK
mmetsp:Transcript_22109/g.30762  ORF Transcript_22109/g.30762 Transcript_22109/m.30762 type:complete len:97 (-) Transcript_22109:115-405(-)